MMMAEPNQGVVGGQPAAEQQDQADRLSVLIRRRRQELLVEVAPTETQRLGRWTIVGLILNRTIGTGIFAQPSNVLYLAGSPAVAVIIWIVGGLIILAITLSWLELGLTVPRYFVNSEGRHFWTPRSGGDKNYLEFIYTRPRQWMSCVFGITFILFGNLAGNAIQFGIYMQTAISPHCGEGDACFNKWAVNGWAIFILTLCCLLNICTRRLFVYLINGFAIAKYALVLATALIGIIYGASHGDGCRTNMAWSNRGSGGEFGDIALALFYGMYSYTGFEQPFYVLSEIDRPRDYFVKYVLIALASVLVLFPITNVGYLCVVPYSGSNSVPVNMALTFVDIVVRGNNPTADTTGAQQGVSVALAIVIFGTIMSQTFTGALVKQEIAREAIIPWYRAISRSNDSLFARWLLSAEERNPETSENYADTHPVQVPIAATALHLIFAVILVIIAGATTSPSTAYRILTYLRVFSIIVVLGILTVLGLAYLKIDSWWHGVRGRGDESGDENEVASHDSDGDDGETQRGGRRWLAIRQWSPPLDPLPTFVACLALVFLGFATCASPSQIRDTDVPYWINPLVGWMIPFLGMLWWLGLRFWQWWTRRIIVVKRSPAELRIVNDQVEMKGEVIEFDKIKISRARELGMA